MCLPWDEKWPLEFPENVEADLEIIPCDVPG